MRHETNDNSISAQILGRARATRWLDVLALTGLSWFITILGLTKRLDKCLVPLRVCASRDSHSDSGSASAGTSASVGSSLESHAAWLPLPPGRLDVWLTGWPPA